MIVVNNEKSSTKWLISRSILANWIKRILTDIKQMNLTRELISKDYKLTTFSFMHVAWANLNLTWNLRIYYWKFYYCYITNITKFYMLSIFYSHSLLNFRSF